MGPNNFFPTREAVNLVRPKTQKPFLNSQMLAWGGTKSNQVLQLFWKKNKQTNIEIEIEIEMEMEGRGKS